MKQKKLENFKGIDLVSIASKFGTPTYVYNLDKVEEKFKTLLSSIPYKNKKILFAMKSNFNPEILRLIKDLGGGVDAVSVGEVMYALELGFRKEDILFTGIGVSEEDIKFCIENEIMLNIGSIDLLERVGAKFPNSRVSIRINPDYGAGHHNHVITGGPHSKFGIYETYLEEVEKLSKKYNLTVIGVHFHIGSGVLDSGVYTNAIRKALEISKMFKEVEFVDIGGGIGIPYKPEQDPFDIEKFGEEISNLFEDFSASEGRSVKLVLEPGRYLVAESGVLLTKVVELKKTPLYNFVIVDTGFNHLIRPVMYGSYHEIINLSKLNLQENEEQVIAGNICESGDVFTRDENGILPRTLPKPDYNDIIGIFDVGAYGFSMASHYNLRRLPKEVVVKNGELHLTNRDYIKFIL